MSVSVLDPSKLSLTVLGCQVEGFSKGSFVSVEKTDPTFSTRTSLKGSKMAGRNRFKDYTLTFSLNNTAGANIWLHAIYKIQEAYGITFPVPVIYKDLNGTSSFFCPAVIIQEPRLEQGSEVYPTEWTFICPRGANTIGGSNIDAKVSDILSTVSALIQAASLLDINVSEISTIANQIRDRATSSWRNLF
ncbi:hypothetical protein [Acinetobacter baumannii]|uniref:hypothetical protein n=1 Tax=Acinetobacter baumannii TaxID=470 RepID=UPI0036715B81